MDKNLSWEAREYIYQKKPRDWYWALTIVIVAIAVTSIILGNILFAVLILLAGFSLALFAVRPPRKVAVSISEEAITIGDKKYPIKNFFSFNIDTLSNPPKLLLRRHETFSLLLSVAIEGVSPEQVAATLAELIEKDEELNEPWFQTLMEYLGF